MLTVAKHFVGEKVIVSNDLQFFNDECKDSDLYVTKEMLQFAGKEVTITSVEDDADGVNDGEREYYSLYLIEEDAETDQIDGEGFFWEDRMFE